MTTDDGLKGLTDGQWASLYEAMTNCTSAGQTLKPPHMITHEFKEFMRGEAARAWLAANVHDSGDGVRALVDSWREKAQGNLSLGMKGYYLIFNQCADELEAILAEKGEL